MSPGHLLRRCVRRLVGEPGSSLAIVLLFAIGIGTSTALFGFTHGILLRPLPGVAEPQELVTLMPRPFELPSLGGATFRRPVDAAAFAEYRRRTASLSGLVTWENLPVHLSTGERGLRLEAQRVSEGFFPLLGVAAAAGRLDLGEGDERRVVLASDLARRLFAGAAAAVGEKAVLNGEPFTVVGVAGGGFRGPWLHEMADLWLPAGAGGWLEAAAGGGETPAATSGPPPAAWMIGRLAAGADPAAVEREMAARTREIAAETGAELSGLDVTASAGRRPGLAERARRGLLLLAAVALLVLAIACLNAGSLLLARTLRRRAEIGVRMALGASRRTIAAALVVEALLLTALGAALGLLLVQAIGRALPATGLVPRLPVAEIPMGEPRVIAFALGAALAVGLLTSLWPTLRALGADPAAALSGRRGATAGRRGAAFHLVLGLQVAVTLVLLLGAVLLAQAGRGLRAVDLGFTARETSYVRLDLGRQGYDEGTGRRFWQSLLDTAGADPALTGTSLALTLPLVPQGDAGRLAGLAAPGLEETLWAPYDVVSPGFFRALGIERLAGRTFRPAERADGEPVMVVNRTLARSLGGVREAVGRKVRLGEGERRVVGVVGDVHWHQVEEAAEPRFYLPLAQSHEDTAFLLAEHRLGGEAALERLRHHVHRLDADLPTFQSGTLGAAVDAATAQPRLLGFAFLAGSLLAAVLACLGVVALVDRTMADRLPEVGIRLALGADRATVRRRILAPVAVTATAGVVAGLAAGLAVYGLLRGQLFGVEPLNPVAVAGGVGGLVLLLLAGAGWPAYRLTRVRDLAQILRQG